METETWELKLSYKWMRNLVLPLFLFLGLSAWAFASPIGASPDEDYHLASIWCSHGTSEGICETGATSESRKVPEVLMSSECYRFLQGVGSECTEGYSSTALIDTERGSFTGTYPPIFYWVMGLFVTGHPIISLMLMRLFNAALFVAAITTLTATRPKSLAAVPLWVIPTVFIPLGMFIVPSINPSSWALISAVVVLPFTYMFFVARKLSSIITAASFATVGVVMGAGARGDSAVYAVLAVGLGTFLGFQKNREGIKRLFLPVILAVFSAVLFFSIGQSAILSPETSPAPLTLAAILHNFATNIVQLPQLWAGSLGTTQLGWLDTPMPALVWVSTIFVFSGVTFWSLKKLHWKKSLSLAVMVSALIAVPMYIYVHDQVTVGFGVQARYILPLLIMFVIVVLLDLSPNLDLNRAQIWVVAVVAAVANSLALRVNLRRYITGLDIDSPNLDSQVEWWWSNAPSPMFVWIIGSLSFFGFLTFALTRIKTDETGQNRTTKPQVTQTL